MGDRYGVVDSDNDNDNDNDNGNEEKLCLRLATSK
jgi:hypothetical protein